MRASVIIPTCGRPIAVREAISSVLALDPSQSSTELLVVDNNDDSCGDDARSADLRKVCAAEGSAVRYVAEPSPGLSAARYRGAREANGEILIYVDDDVRVSAGWLDALLRAFDDSAVGIAGGPSIPLFRASVPAWFWDFVEPHPCGGWSCGWLSLLDIGRTVEGIDPVWIWGLNYAIRRETLTKLGGFHPDLVPSALQRWQGDGETGLSLKAKASGVKATYVHEAMLRHVIDADRLTPEYFAKRARYQAVCDSFTRIRSGANPREDARPPRRTKASGGPWTEVARDVRARVNAAYRDGWAFHQREAARDPRLLAWIRRKHYEDADIRAEMGVREAAKGAERAGNAAVSAMGRRFLRYASVIAPNTVAKAEARGAFRKPPTTPILVYQMGKVGSTTVVESLERAGLANAILHLHAISEDVEHYRKVHAEAGAGVPYHLALGEAVGDELARGNGERCKVISLVRDPIAVQVSGLFEVPQFAPKEMRSRDGAIDPARAAEHLNASLARPREFDYIFEWFDREVLRVFGIDVFAHPFPKERGAAVFRGETADLLLIRLEDLSRAGPLVLGEFLGLDAPLELVRANVRAEKPEAQAYRALLGRLRLDRELCERIYASRFARHFYTDEEIRGFIAKWSEGSS